MSEVLFDEWINCADGMPRFGLRGDDPEAPPTILYWAQLRRMRWSKEPESDQRTKELQQCTEAEQIAWKMQDYQAGHAVDESPVETLREEQKTAKYHSDRVSNAIGEVSEAMRYLNQFGPLPPHFAHSVKHLKILADQLLPKAYKK